jgi:hypothetical protein
LGFIPPLFMVGWIGHSFKEDWACDSQWRPVLVTEFMGGQAFHRLNNSQSTYLSQGDIAMLKEKAKQLEDRAKQSEDRAKQSEDRAKQSQDRAIVFFPLHSRI